MEQRIRDLLAKIQGKNYEQVKKIVKEASPYVKDEMIRKVTTEEDYEILKRSPKYEEIRDRTISAEMYQFLDSLSYSGYTDDPFVERQLSKKDFEEFIDFYQKRNLEQVYKSSALKTLKTKYLPEYQEILDFFEEKDMDPNEVKYLGHRRYMYRNAVIFTFEYSPAQVMLEWLMY